MRSTTLSSTLVAMSTLTGLVGAYAAPNFGDDLAFLRQHTEVVLLSERGGAQVAVVPAWQGRVMTSSAGGAGGLSFGWVNRDLITEGKVQPHINVFGGEDRFWLGPEGGQFSIFFAKGVPFDLEHWFTPAVMDTEAFEVVRKSDDRVLCRKVFGLTNYSGTEFQLRVDREVRLLKAASVLSDLGAKLPKGVQAVSFESVNTVRNEGKAAWKQDTGLLSIWILGMFNAAAETTVVVPFKTGPESELGPVVNDTYFGKVPANRLVVKDGVLFFAADANFRSKIGIPPRRAKPVLGSYDAANRVLTLVKFTLPKGQTEYVNSMWELQKNPFGGDAVNSYNDGPPPTGGKQLGRFYELESSSPALALKAGASAKHTHQTVHLTGDEAALDAIAQATLGVTLAQIKSALK
jgi:hypothetical protein